MPQSQNIIELGFDTAQLSAESKEVIDYLNKVYDICQKIDNTKLMAQSMQGFGEMSKVLSDQKKSFDEVSESVDKL